MSLEQIKNFWAGQAAQHGQRPAASWSDVHAVDLEIRTISRYLEASDRVLDIGCGNGYSTVQLAALSDIDIRGIDYIPEMIEHARARGAQLPEELKRRVAFDVGNVLALDEPSDSYDKAVVVRVLINLGEWERQVEGLRECIRVVRPGGLLLLSEASVQGWTRLNAMRKEWGLEQIPMPAFNNYLDEDRLTLAAAPKAELVAKENFSSTYFVGTRVLKPLLARLAPGIDPAQPDMEINRWLSQAPSWGDYGTQKLFVFRKTTSESSET